MNTKTNNNLLAKKLKNKILATTAVSVLALSLGIQPTINVKAAGITPTVTPSASTVSTAGTISLAFTTSANLASGSTI